MEFFEQGNGLERVAVLQMALSQRLQGADVGEVEILAFEQEPVGVLWRVVADRRVIGRAAAVDDELVGVGDGIAADGEEGKS